MKGDIIVSLRYMFYTKMIVNKGGDIHCCGQLWVWHMICGQTCDGLYHFHFGESLIFRLYSEIDHIHLSSEAQCVTHLYPQVDCHIHCCGPRMLYVWDNTSILKGIIMNSRADFLYFDIERGWHTQFQCLLLTFWLLNLNYLLLKRIMDTYWLKVP